MNLLEILHTRSQASFAILTNGTLIDADTACHLQKLQPAYVQVSIEGGRETHDQIRGEVAFGKRQRASGILLSQWRARVYLPYRSPR